jgi:hypothetical protein
MSRALVADLTLSVGSNRYPILRCHVVHANGIAWQQSGPPPKEQRNASRTAAAAKSSNFPGFALPDPRPVHAKDKPDRTPRAALVCLLQVPCAHGSLPDDPRRHATLAPSAQPSGSLAAAELFDTHLGSVSRAGPESLWCTNVALDEGLEESRLLQINSLLNQIQDLEPSFAAHLLCGGFNCLRSDDYSEGAWDMMTRDASTMRGGGDEEAQLPQDLVMKSLLSRYRDARDEAGLHSFFADGARVEGTTEADTRVDYILLSQKLPWSVRVGGYDLKVRPRGLPEGRYLSCPCLPPPAHPRWCERLLEAASSSPQAAGARARRGRSDGFKV